MYASLLLLLLPSWLLADDEVVGEEEKACSSWLLMGGLGCSSVAVDQLSTGFMPGARDICGDGKPGICCSEVGRGQMFGWFIRMLPKPDGDLGACCCDHIPPPYPKPEPNCKKDVALKWHQKMDRNTQIKNFSMVQVPLILLISIRVYGFVDTST